VILQKKNAPQDALKEFRTARDLNSNEEIFELYYFMTLFHLRDWKALTTTMPRFQKSKFFICVAEAQNDASKIAGLDEFQTDFVQVPLIAFELALIHGRQDLIEKYKKSSSEEFGKSGWPQLIEGAFLRQAGDFEKALPLLQEAYSKKCPRSFLELGIALAKLKRFEEARDLFDDESKLRILSADEKKVLEYINAQIN
jgi:tetratricopeptide (TPR) repeat protein